MLKQSVTEAIEALSELVHAELNLPDDAVVDVSLNIAFFGLADDDAEVDEEDFEDESDDDELEEDDDESEEDDDEELEDDDESEEDDDEDGEEYHTEETLTKLTIGELRAIAKDFEIPTTGLKKPEIIAAILEDPDEE